MQSGCLPELVPNPDNSSGIYDTVETVSNSGTGAVYEGEQSQPQVIYGGQGKKQWSDGGDYTSAADHSDDDTVLVVWFSTRRLVVITHEHGNICELPLYSAGLGMLKPVKLACPRKYALE